MEIKIPEYAEQLVERLEANGKEAYIVGGSLRDTLLGKSPSDYDMTTSALPTEMLEIFADYRVIETGLKHGTLTVISQGRPVEITTFRIDGGYTDSRHPDSVSFTRSLSKDLERRDFTVNAMAYNRSVGLVDIFGGESDLERKIIRAVGEPRRRFEEDALRIMRAFRFSAQLGFEIEKDTLACAIECRERLSNIAIERIFSELLRLLLSPYPQTPLMLMKQGGILKYMLGEYLPSDRLISLVSSAPLSDTARLGLLLCEAEPEAQSEILAALKCSNRQRSGALAVARGGCESPAREADVSRFISKYGENSEDALRVSVLLGNSREEVLALARTNSAPRSIKELAVDGADLALLGFEGREIGKMLARLLDLSLDNPSINSKEELLRIAREYKKVD